MTNAAYTPLEMPPSDSASPSPQAPINGLHPGMIYRPLSPTDTQSLDGNENGDVRRRWKCNTSLISVFRLIIAAIALSDAIYWISSGGVLGGEDCLVFLCVWLFFILFWNVGILLKQPLSSFRRRSRNRGILGLPTIICQMGDWGFVLNADEEDRVDKVPTRKTKKIPLAWLGDVLFGSVAIVVAAIGFNNSGYWYRRTRAPAFGMSITVGTLEIIVAILSLLSSYGSIVLEGGVMIKKTTDPYQPIRLPDDEEGHDDRRTAGISASEC